MGCIYIIYFWSKFFWKLKYRNINFIIVCFSQLLETTWCWQKQAKSKKTTFHHIYKIHTTFRSSLIYNSLVAIICVKYFLIIQETENPETIRGFRNNKRIQKQSVHKKYRAKENARSKNLLETLRIFQVLFTNSWTFQNNI